jgi:hypothetical protein
MEAPVSESARIDPADHLARPWRVHALAPDFALLDVWRFPIRGNAHELPRFARAMLDMERTLANTNRLTRALFAVRVALGRVFGWDRERAPLPIPGCREHSLRARLPDGVDVTTPRSEAAFYPVYEDERELVAETSNGTVHAFMHLGWIEVEGTNHEFAPQMAVYVKHRGLLGRLYMALIGPFRHLVVYPSLIRAAVTRWSAEKE